MWLLLWKGCSFTRFRQRSSRSWTSVLFVTHLSSWTSTFLRTLLLFYHVELNGVQFCDGLLKAWCVSSKLSASERLRRWNEPSISDNLGMKPGWHVVFFPFRAISLKQLRIWDQISDPGWEGCYRKKLQKNCSTHFVQSLDTEKRERSIVLGERGFVVYAQ